MNTSRVIVTAGGTTEAIDDVRLLSSVSVTAPQNSLVKLSSIAVENISSGNFGKQIAEEFVRRGYPTTLIGKRQLIRDINSPPALLKLVSFRSVLDLQQAIATEVAASTPQFFLMAAAVSDYSPLPFSGKMSSAEDTLTLTLRRNPKLLDDLRKQMGSACTVVGFKLVSGLSEPELVKIAAAQNERAKLSATVANDLQQIDFATGEHPIKLVLKDGSVIPIAGHRTEVAQQLVATLINSFPTAP